MLFNNKKVFRLSIFLAKPSIMLVQFHCSLYLIQAIDTDILAAK